MGHCQRCGNGGALAADPAFDLDRRMIRLDSGAREVMPRTWQVILFLAARIGRLVRRDTLYDELWPAHLLDTPDPKGLDVQIHYARQALEGSHYRIVTIRDAGWILEATPEELPAPQVVQLCPEITRSCA